MKKITYTEALERGFDNSTAYQTGYNEAVDAANVEIEALTKDRDSLRLDNAYNSQRCVKLIEERDALKLSGNDKEARATHVAEEALWNIKQLIEKATVKSKPEPLTTESLTLGEMLRNLTNRIEKLESSMKQAVMDGYEVQFFDGYLPDTRIITKIKQP